MTPDHDRGVGPRGEEEASRGPASSQDQPTREAPIPYGTHAELPDAEVTPQNPLPEPRRGEFREFLRLRYTQVIGAGLVGLVAGAAIGGTVMASRGDHVRGPSWDRGAGDAYQPLPPDFRIYERPERPVIVIPPPQGDG